jgi:hypothetical protein
MGVGNHGSTGAERVRRRASRAPEHGPLILAGLLAGLLLAGLLLAGLLGRQLPGSGGDSDQWARKGSERLLLSPFRWERALPPLV